MCYKGRPDWQLAKEKLTTCWRYKARAICDGNIIAKQSMVIAERYLNAASPGIAPGFRGLNGFLL
ncbi:MAG: hypothetical protein CL398_01670 [Acidiferrobacteraceae bacterium]|nr:hypothetical protein [Acidiferrobacteraceae bacterium]